MERRKAGWWPHTENIMQMETQALIWSYFTAQFRYEGFADFHWLNLKAEEGWGLNDSLARTQDKSLPWHAWLNRSIQHCAGERDLFIESGGKALPVAHYQTTYALCHFLFICYKQQGTAKTRAFLSLHLFDLFFSYSFIVLVGEGSLNSNI